MPTISEQLTQLISDRDDLVDNLTTKGISGLTGDETFTELVPEVLNIPGGGDISEYFLNTLDISTSGIGLIKKIPNNTTVTGTSLQGVFKNFISLTTIPLLNTNNITNMTGMFDGCAGLKSVPLINTSNVTSMSTMFQNCQELEEIPQFDTGNVQNMASMFKNCYKLKTIPLLDFKNLTRLDNIFSSCNNLENLNGFQNLGNAYDSSKSANYTYYNLILSSSTKITHDSLMNVINNLYDIATKGCNAQRLVIGATNLAKLSSAEIAIATNKGWTVS